MSVNSLPLSVNDERTRGFLHHLICISKSTRQSMMSARGLSKERLHHPCAMPVPGPAAGMFKGKLGNHQPTQKCCKTNARFADTITGLRPR